MTFHSLRATIFTDYLQSDPNSPELGPLTMYSDVRKDRDMVKVFCG